MTGFHWNSETIRAVHPNRFATRLQRAVRLPSSRELATALQTFYQICHSPPPAQVERAEELRGLLNKAGIADDATYEKGILFGQIEEMLVF